MYVQNDYNCTLVSDILHINLHFIACIVFRACVCVQYVPMKGDRVLGVVTKTTGKSYRVDIGSAMSAFLPELAFEGATKRNRPNLQVEKGWV